MQVSGVNATAQAFQSLSQFAALASQEKSEVRENDNDADDAVKNNTRATRNQVSTGNKVSGEEHDLKLSRTDQVQQNKAAKESVKAAQFFNQSGQIENSSTEAREVDVFA